MKKVSKLLKAVVAIYLSFVLMFVNIPAVAYAEPITVTHSSSGVWSSTSGSITVTLAGTEQTWMKINNGAHSVYCYVNGAPETPSNPQHTADILNLTFESLRNWFGLDPNDTVTVNWETNGDIIYFSLASPDDSQSSKSNVHVHNYKYQTIKAPTIEADGLEGEMCSCGAVRNIQPLSAYAFALNEYATPMINAAKPGQTITFEFGEMNSFPKSFMQKLVEKNGQNVTFVFHYKWNHVKQEIKIPAGTPVDLNFDWYGPAKMAELYGMN